MGSLETVFRALADRHRRRVLTVLQTHHTVSLADLAESVAESERERDLSAISPEEVKEVYFALYHTHVPLLEAANLVDYDQEDDLVSWTSETARTLVAARDSVDALVD